MKLETGGWKESRGEGFGLGGALKGGGWGDRLGKCGPTGRDCAHSFAEHALKLAQGCASAGKEWARQEQKSIERPPWRRRQSRWFASS